MRGLLTDNKTWYKTMHKAILTTNPKSVRHVFSLLLVYSELQDPLSLYSEFVNSMGEDFRRKTESTGLSPDMEQLILQDKHGEANYSRGSST